MGDRSRIPLTTTSRERYLSRKVRWRMVCPWCSVQFVPAVVYAADGNQIVRTQEFCTRSCRSKYAAHATHNRPQTFFSFVYEAWPVQE